MLKFSRIAFAATLMASAAGLVASPAFAKKDDKPAAAAGSQLKIGEAVRKVYGAAQASLAAKDVAGAETNVAAVEAVAKTSDEMYVAQQLRLSLEVLKLQSTGNASNIASEASLAKPLDALIANPSTPKADMPRFLYLRGSLAFNARQYPVALDLFTRAKAAGSTEGDLSLMIVKSKMETGDTAGALAELDNTVKAETAAGRAAPEDWYRYAIAKANAAKTPGSRETAVVWMQRYIKAYPTTKNWRDVLITFGFDANAAKLSKGQLVDLFRLMRASKSLDQAGYQEYAQTALDNLGLPAEARTVIEEGRAAGKIPAGGGAQILTDAATASRNDTPPAVLEKRAQTAADGQAASQTGDSYLATGNYAKAAEMYRLALQKGLGKSTARNAATADDVNTHLGIALARSGDKAGARTAFAAVTGEPSNQIAGFWTIWLDAPAA